MLIRWSSFDMHLLCSWSLNFVCILDLESNLALMCLIAQWILYFHIFLYITIYGNENVDFVYRFLILFLGFNYEQIEKIPVDDIKNELKSAGVSEEAIEQLLQVLSIKSLTKLEGWSYRYWFRNYLDNIFFGYTSYMSMHQLKCILILDLLMVEEHNVKGDKIMWGKTDSLNMIKA